MRQQGTLHPFASGDDEARAQTDPVQPRAADPDVPKHEAEHGQTGEIDLPAVRPEGDVITEPGRHFRGVSHTADPCQHHHVVQRHPRLGPDAQAFAQAHGDQP